MLQALLIPVVLAFLGASAVSAEESDVHSGRLMKISLDAKTITVEEIGPWMGPDTGRVERTFTLTPSTSVTLLRRAQGADAKGWAGGFESEPLALTELKPGDFATVTAKRADDRLTALSIGVVRPGSP
jgi:hypothetical protein